MQARESKSLGSLSSAVSSSGSSSGSWSSSPSGSPSSPGTDQFPFQRLDAYRVARALAELVCRAGIADAELRDQATRAAKSAFLNPCVGLPDDRPAVRRRYFRQADGSVHELAGALDLAGARRDLDRGRRLARFAASDDEGPCPVGRRRPTSTLGGVEAGRLGGAEGLVAQVGVADARGADGREQVESDLVGEEAMLRQP